MILVTGGTGTIGKELVKDLQARKVDFRVMVRTSEARSTLEGKGIKAVLGDFEHPKAITAAMAGVKKVFLLTTPRPDIVKIEGAFLDAARKVGIESVVRISAQGANPWAVSPLLRLHGQCETQLEDSGRAWTHLRPTMFMQNIVGMYGDSVAKTSTLFAPAGEARIPFVDARDIAEVAGLALTKEGHDQLVHELTGPEACTYDQIALILGQKLGRIVKFVDVPDDAAYQTMLNMGMSPWFAHGILTLFHAFRANGATAVPLGNVARLTGRQPRTLEAYLQEHLKVFQSVQTGSAIHSV